jgi:class 3 adenylate cyclase
MEMRSYRNLSIADIHNMNCQACQTFQEADLDHHIQVGFTLNHSIQNLKTPDLDVKTAVGRVPATLEEFLQAITPEQNAFLNAIETMNAEHKPLTGMELVHNQLFRDFFKDQVLPVNISLKVTRVALIFTDLRGSTAMYAAKGDPAAYELVRQHFDLLTEETLRHKGVVIKTIGDAVMASFLTDLDAAEAAIGYQKIIAQFNADQELNDDNALILKVGVHSGPCLSVNLNSVMDYFGTTVNMAARIGALSKGNDIVTSAAILSNPAVRTTFEEGGFITGESMRVQLRGIPEETEVYRLSKAAN